MIDASAHRSRRGSEIVALRIATPSTSQASALTPKNIRASPMRVRTNNARNGSKTNTSNKMPTNSAGAASNNCCHQSIAFVPESDMSANTMYAMIATSNGIMTVKTEGTPGTSSRVCVFMLLDGHPERHESVTGWQYSPGSVIKEGNSAEPTSRSQDGPWRSFNWDRANPINIAHVSHLPDRCQRQARRRRYDRSGAEFER